MTTGRGKLEFDLRARMGFGVQAFKELSYQEQWAIVEGLSYYPDTFLGSEAYGLERPASFIELTLIDLINLTISANTDPRKGKPVFMEKPIKKKAKLDKDDPTIQAHIKLLKEAAGEAQHG